jgi:hypothetical protein
MVTSSSDVGRAGAGLGGVRAQAAAPKEAIIKAMRKGAPERLNAAL